MPELKLFLPEFKVLEDCCVTHSGIDALGRYIEDNVYKKITFFEILNLYFLISIHWILHWI
jgi:hypothetical protein